VKKRKAPTTAKDRASERLFKAVANYVKVYGGKVLVTGNVHIIKFPGDLKLNWTFGVRCTGLPPKTMEPA
jgi:hypothetical protein